jgi:hypothetical protein
MIVYVVTYEHKHGTDVSIHSTEAKAWEAIDAIKAESPEDFDEDSPRGWCDISTCELDT